MSSILRPPTPFVFELPDEEFNQVLLALQEHPSIDLVERAAQYGLAAMLKVPELAALVPLLSDATSLQPNDDLGPLFTQLIQVIEQIRKNNR